MLFYRKTMQKQCHLTASLSIPQANLGGFISNSHTTHQRYPRHNSLAQFSEKCILGLADVSLGSNTPLLPAVIPKSSKIFAFWAVHRNNYRIGYLTILEIRDCISTSRDLFETNSTKRRVTEIKQFSEMFDPQSILGGLCGTIPWQTHPAFSFPEHMHTQTSQTCGFSTLRAKCKLHGIKCNCCIQKPQETL